MRVTKKAVQKIALDIAREKPKNTNPRAFFAHPKNGQPCCVVGHIFRRLDPAVFKAVKEVEQEDFISFPLHGAYLTRLQGRGVTFTDAAKRYLSTVQRFADHGSPWSEAVEAAEEGWEGE